MARDRERGASGAEVIFEFRRIGETVKVSAVDPVTNTEVSIMAPARSDPRALKLAAVRKLRYVIAKAGREGKGGR